MAKSIGSMVAVVSATSGKFSKDINAIRGDVRGLKGTVEKSEPKGGLFAALGAGGAIGAGIVAAQAGIRMLTNAVQGFFDTFTKIEELGDFAAQIGATTEEISGLRFAADQMGSSAEAMDKGLEKMVVRIGEARGGAKETQEAFRALGVDVDELANMTAGEALKAIADGFKDIKSPADQAALATDIFGRSSLDLVNVLNQGADCIDEMIERARELGIVLDEAAVKRASEASLALKELKAAGAGLKTELTIGLAPALQLMAQLTTDMIATSRSLVGALDLTTVEWVAQAAAIGIAIALAPKIVAAIIGIVKAFRAMAMAGATAQALSGPAGWASLAASLGAAALAAVAVNKLFDQIEESQKRVGAANKKRQAGEDTLAKAEEAAKAAAEAQRELDAMMRRGEQIAKGTRTPFEVWSDSLDDLTKLLDVGAINWKNYERAVAKAADTLDKATLSKEKAERFQPTQAIGAALRGTAGGFSAVQSAIRGTADAERKQEARDKEQLEETKKSNKSLKLIEEALSRGRAVQRAVDI